MTDAKIGRLLAASLHQSIADLLPTRLEFYESWLDTERLREKGFDRAPFSAVCSFLRREADRYDEVVTRAGRYAAEWAVATLPAGHRVIVRSTPGALRPRAVLWLVSRTIRELYRETGPRIRFRKGVAEVELRASPFCDVREETTHPLCGFYVAAIGRFLELFGIAATAHIVECRAGGHPHCLLSVKAIGEASVDW